MTKLILMTFTALQINFAEATDSAFEACESLPVMAVLTKDNYPYWTQASTKIETAEQCYALVYDVANNGSADDLKLLQKELKGQLKIFKTDAAFSKFVVEQEDFQQMQINNPHNVKPHLIPLVKTHFQFTNQIK